MDEGKQHLETLISAAHDGNVEGQFYLGVAYLKNKGVEQDDDQALHLTFYNDFLKSVFDVSQLIDCRHSNYKVIYRDNRS